jgi:hypothetical protein
MISRIIAIINVKIGALSMLGLRKQRQAFPTQERLTIDEAERPSRRVRDARESQPARESKPIRCAMRGVSTLMTQAAIP